MQKAHIFAVAFAATLAFGVLSVASASATLWLVAGKSLTVAKVAAVHGAIILKSGGNEFECSTLWIGQVGPGDKDEYQLIESLSGEKDLAVCKTLRGTCGSKPIIHFLRLPWASELILKETKTWDEIKEGGGGGRPTFLVLCLLGVEVECSGNIEDEFEGNGTNGADFEFKGTESGELSCSNGEKATLSSPSNDEALGSVDVS